MHLYTDRGVLLKLIFTEETMEFEAIGTEIIRGEERIDIAPLPDVFTNIPAEEYELLSPLAAKAFVVEDMRTQTYLNPEKYTNASQEVWDSYFFSDSPDGYYEGAHMDFHVIVPLAKTADAGRWEKSALDKVKTHILRQLDD